MLNFKPHDLSEMSSAARSVQTATAGIDATDPRLQVDECRAQLLLPLRLVRLLVVAEVEELVVAPDSQSG